MRRGARPGNPPPGVEHTSCSPEQGRPLRISQLASAACLRLRLPDLRLRPGSGLPNLRPCFVPRPLNLGSSPHAGMLKLRRAGHSRLLSVRLRR